MNNYGIRRTSLKRVNKKALKNRSIKSMYHDSKRLRGMTEDGSARALGWYAWPGMTRENMKSRCPEHDSWERKKI